MKHRLIALFEIFVINSFIFNVSPTTSTIWNTKECGSLTKHLNGSSTFHTVSLPLYDGTQITNFHEEYAKGGHDGSLAESWGNLTNSFSVANGCALTVCNEPHLSGECLTMSSTDSLLQTPRNVLSASCVCPSTTKTCPCSQIYMKKTACARAYLKPGCNVCNPYYLELSDGTKDYFSSSVISDIKVRDGCLLHIFDEVELNGDLEELEGGRTHEGFNRTIASYECTCDRWFFVPKPTPPPIQYPFPAVNVPKTIDEVSSMILGKYGRHPGLMASLASLKNRRSSKNAYILLVGSTGSGKSSAINLLFDNPNITRVGGYKSTTTDIHEFRIPIKLDELGISNAELRVIDTPGLLDTRGMEQDARFLATLDEYFTQHEELSTRLPNAILIFHKFDDNRYDGEGSDFVKMIRGLDSLRTRIVDETYSNVVFVFSHFCSLKSDCRVTKKAQESKLRKLKNVIESHTQFPKPVVLTVAENKGGDHFLPMVNGYYSLPSGEFYPRNLFEKIQTVTSSCGDPIGDAVIRSAFKDSDDFNTSSVDFPLVLSSHPKVPKYLRILVDTAIKVEKTEVSQLLSQAATKMTPELKRKHPLSLNILQKALSIRNIRTLKDVPKTDLGMLELLSSLQQNKAVMFLLKTGLKINPPLFPHQVVAGHSYSVFRDSVLPKSPFKLGDDLNSDIGYLFPSSLSCVLENHVDDFLSISFSEEEYVSQRMRSLGIDGSIPFDKFSGRRKAGYNIQNPSQILDQTSCELSALREFRTFKLVLNDKPQQREEFRSRLLSLPNFNESDHAVVHVWTTFFDEYGTHVVNQVYGGGSIEIKVWSNSTCDGTLASALFQFIQFAEDITLINEESVQTTLRSQGIRHTLSFKGGDQAYHTQDLTSMPLEEASTLLKNWKKSLKLNPVILATEMKLLPLSELAKSVGQNVSSEIQRVTSLLFNSSMNYVPPAKDSNFGGRDSIKIVESYSTMNELLQAFLNQSQTAQKKYTDMLVKLDEQKEQFEKQALEEQSSFDEWIKQQDKLLKNMVNADAANRNQLQAQRQQRMEDRIRYQEELERQRRADELRRRLERERIERENAARLAEIRRQMEEEANRRRSRRRGGSCLKTGTKILLAAKDRMNNYKEKVVEEIQVGDEVLDANLTSVKVLGISREFLMDQTFFGFEKSSEFFTDSHILVGPQNQFNETSDNVQLKFFVQDKQRLMDQNPLMRYINPVEMSKTNSFKMFYFNPETQNVEGKSVQLHKSRQNNSEYPKDTLVYFLHTSSPTGTYFANNYLCKDEVPPIKMWPNTMAVLLQLSSDPGMVLVVSSIPYTLQTLSTINRIVTLIEKEVVEAITTLNLTEITILSATSRNQLQGLSIASEEQSVSEIFSHPTFSAFAMGVYGSLSPFLACHLDQLERNSCHPDWKPFPPQYIPAVQSFTSDLIISLCATNLQIHFSEYFS